MQTLLTVSTIETIIDRFGGYRPAFVGTIPSLPTYGFVDAILASNFRENEFMPTPNLIIGDQLQVHLPDNTTPYIQSGVLTTAIVQSVATQQVPNKDFPKCPSCGWGMSRSEIYWCENVACNSRLVGRMCYLSSADGLKYPWFIDKNLTEHFIHHMRFRSLAKFFDPAEMSIAEDDVLPRHIASEIVGWLHALFNRYRHSPQACQQILMVSLLNSLSYPGIDMSRAFKMVSRAFHAHPASPLRYIAQAFVDQTTLAYLMDINPQQTVLIQYLIRQLRPYHKEISRIFDHFTDEPCSI